MRRWAFATSPYGLGLDANAFLSLTPREFEALCEVRKEAMKFTANGFALFANANFRGRDEPVWEPGHFVDKPRAASRIITAAELKRWQGYQHTRKDAPLPAWAKTGLPKG